MSSGTGTGPLTNPAVSVGVVTPQVTALLKLFDYNNNNNNNDALLRENPRCNYAIKPPQIVGQKPLMRRTTFPRD